MNLDLFIRDRRPSWDELQQLLAQAKGRPERLGADGVRRLGVLYRSAAADLAVARRRFAAEAVAASLEDLVGRAHTAVYGGAVRRESAVAFLSRGYWRRVAERPALLMVATALLLLPMAATALWAHADPGGAGGLMPATTRSVASPREKGTDLGLSPGERTELAATIFTNNIRVSFAAVAGGITAGLLTAGVLVFNGVTLGVVAGLGVGAGNGRALTELIVPHGV
ncbi:MAG: stage II sporulation protein M, partial [Actinobacteria bacterium]|nr:stage II sporulation protein M [Actinomycetota bacterium]